MNIVKYLNRSLFIVLVCAFHSNAQTRFENIQAKNWLPDTIKFFEDYKNVKRQFKKHRIIELSKNFSQKLTQNKKCALHLKLDSLHDWKLELEPYSIFSSNYSRKINVGDSLVSSDNSMKTFKGIVNGKQNNAVRISVVGNVVNGLIIENGHQFYLEPVKSFYKNINKSNTYILYEASDVILEAGTCTMIDVHEHNLYRKSFDEIQAGEGCVEVDIAIAADYAFVESRGGVEAAEQRIINILNLVNGIYSAKPLEIEYKIVATFLSSASNSDPWNTTNNASQLLSSFQTWGNRGGFGKTFDVASLWTSRNLEANGNNSIVGIAYVGAVCNNFRYNVLEHYSNNINAVMINQCHELGHNWNCEHANGTNFIMNPTIGISNIDWDQTSINSIIAWKGDANCLSNCGPKAPVADFNYSQLVSCDGKISFRDNSLNSPTQWLWEFGDGAISSDRNPTHQYTQNGIYTLKLKVSNNQGEDELVKAEAIKVNIIPAPIVQDAARCGSGEVVLKIENPNNNYITQWFDSETSSTPIATGSTYTASIDASTNFYVENSTIPQTFKVGPVDNTFSSGANFNSNDLRGLVFDVFTFIQLKSVKVYATGTANREIQLLDTIGGKVLATTIINISNGESRVNLNFDVPPGRNYFLKVRGAVNLFRNQSGGANFPYEINGVLSIKETDVVSVAPKAYYYFYDWEVELKGCNTSRVAVRASNDCNSINAGQSMNSWYSTNYLKDEKSIKITANQDNSKLLNLELIDVIGRVNYYKSIQLDTKGSQYLVPTANLHKGLYILKIYDDTNKSFSQKVLVE